MATPSYHNRKTVPSLRLRPLTPTQRALLEILYRAPSYIVFGQPTPDAPGPAFNREQGRERAAGMRGVRYRRPHSDYKETTRQGSKNDPIVTHAASWGGAVRVEVYHDETTGRDMAHVSLVPWQGNGVRRELYHGPIDEGSPI